MEDLALKHAVVELVAEVGSWHRAAALLGVSHVTLRRLSVDPSRCYARDKVVAKLATLRSEGR